ncbi:hypothetical protein ACTVH1_18220 [Gluconobacter cerinus]
MMKRKPIDYGKDRAPEELFRLWREERTNELAELLPDCRFGAPRPSDGNKN